MILVPENRVDNIIGGECDAHTQTHRHEQHHKKCTSPTVSEQFIVHQLHIRHSNNYFQSQIKLWSSCSPFDYLTSLLTLIQAS